MKIVIEKPTLVRALSHVQSVVEKRNTIPILSNILLVAQDGEVALTATDMDLEVTEIIAAVVERPGSLTVSASMFYEIVRKLTDDNPIVIEASSDLTKLNITCGRSDFQLGILSAQDFPLMSHDGLEFKFDIKADDLRSLVDCTRFSMSTEDARFYLNGIYFHAFEQEDTKIKVLRAASTDGHRLARSEIDLPKGAENIPGVILPRKTVNELRKLIDDAADKITISLSSTKIQFTFDSLVLRSKLIDGNFPDYERVIPDHHDTQFTIDTKQFEKAVDRVATLSNEKSRAVKMRLNGRQLVLSANSVNAGSAVEELELSDSIKALEIGFNAKYVLDIIAQIKSNELLIEMSDAGSPIVLKEVNNNRPLYVLMPMRVS